MNLNEKRIDISIKSNFAVRTEMHHCRKTRFRQMNLHHDLTRKQSNAKYFIYLLKIPILLVIHVIIVHHLMNKHKQFLTNDHRLIIFHYATKLNNSNDCIDQFEIHQREFPIAPQMYGWI